MNQACLKLIMGLVLAFYLVGATLISSSGINIGDVQASTEGERVSECIYSPRTEYRVLDFLLMQLFV